MNPKNKAFIFSSLLVLTILGTIAVPQPAHAATFWDGLGLALQKIVTGAIDLISIPSAIFLQIIQMITGILPVVAGEIFRVALNLNDSIALTPLGADPTKDMVSVGFQFTRDIANMLFILILAWVGFATILRLKSYEIKEIVPKLVMIALLINFIPVITGVILDIASIITKIFADKSTGIALYMWNLLPGVQMIQKGTANFATLIPGNGGISGMAVASLMGIVFNLIAFFMLSLYAIIFIMRIVAIWILIVLAPLAWLGYIIPQGKKMWDMWWKQFIQWAIIGIPLTFFLYLTTFVLSNTSICDLNGPGASLYSTETFEKYGFLEGLLTGIVGDNLCHALPFFAGVIVMLVGFILSITLSPTGADMVIKQAKKGGLVAGKVLGKQAMGGVKEYAKWPGQKIREYQNLRDRGYSRRDVLGGMARHEVRRAGRTLRLPTQDTSILGRTYRDYRLARSMGMSRRDARLQAKMTWDRDLKKERGTPTERHTTAVIKGFKNAIKAGWSAGIGAKAVKTGKKQCPNCRKMIAASAKTCPTPNCGHSFE